MLYFVAPSALCNVQAVQACCPFSKMQKHKREVEVEDKGKVEEEEMQNLNQEK